MAHLDLLNQTIFILQHVDSGVLGTIGKVAGAVLLVLILIGFVPGIIIGLLIGRAMGRRSMRD